MTENQIWFLLIVVLSPIWMIGLLLLLGAVYLLLDIIRVVVHNNICLPIKNKFKKGGVEKDVSGGD